MRNYIKRRKRNMLLIGLVCILLIMTIGYSAFSTRLDIKSSTSITSNWDIEITNLELKEEIGEGKNVTFDFDKLWASMEADFYTPSDEVVYNVTVSNLGNLDGVLDSIKINMDSQDIIEFKVEGINSGDILKKGESTTFEFSMKYNENITSQPEVGSIIFDMNLNYLQKGNSSNFADAEGEIEDTLAINGINIKANETSVETEVEASNAIKYYYSLDNDKWYETTENLYSIYHLTPYTKYTMYIKAEDINGNVVFSSKEFETLDNTKPEVKLTMGDSVKGENDWYKGLNINIEAKDAGGIKESKYCITSEEECIPNNDITLTNGKGTYQFTSSNNEQRLCILVSDRKGNESVKCTGSYKVDSEDPTLSEMKIEPKENTMTITLIANDEDSGVYKYYYSKDSGKNIIIVKIVEIIM